ncbi:MAG: hypothetical protein RLZZ505_2934 [Verrucomicrobiota bacterium]|jgi:hypothetical protein
MVTKGEYATLLSPIAMLQCHPENVCKMVLASSEPRVKISTKLLVTPFSMINQIKKIKKTYSKVTWPYRRNAARLKIRTQVLDDIRHLQPLNISKDLIKKAKSLLICCIGPRTNELPVFMRHYRDMGVEHMLFIDCSGRAEVSDFLKEQKDCSIWTTSLGFKESGYGRRFYNTLLHHYCINKWTFCVDIDELFVFPYMETRSMQDLTGQLDDCERRTLWALGIEIYGSGPLLKTELGSQDLRYFDPSGYYQSYGDNGQIEVRGGPRTRLLDLRQKSKSLPYHEFPSEETIIHQPESCKGYIHPAEFYRAPSLHKLPLVKPDEGVFYSFRQRDVMDKKMNWPHKWHPCPTGVLLTYKYHRQFCESLLNQSDSTSLVPGSDFLDSILVDQLRENPEFSFMERWSLPYESSESLIHHGLLSDGSALRPSAYMATVR